MVGGGGGVESEFSVQLWSKAEQLALSPVVCLCVFLRPHETEAKQAGKLLMPDVNLVQSLRNQFGNGQIVPDLVKLIDLNGPPIRGFEIGDRHTDRHTFSNTGLGGLSESACQKLGSV